MILTKEQLSEFSRLYNEASDVAYDHEEFLNLIFRAAAQIAIRDYNKDIRQMLHNCYPGTD